MCKLLIALDMTIISWLKNKIKRRIGKIALLQNIGYSFDNCNRRMLLSYSIYPYKLNLNDARHTNVFEILELVAIFNKLGFVVDLVESGDKLALPILKKKSYDLLFGFGDVFFEMAQELPSAKTILYMTEHHPDFSEKAEKERIDYYRQRTGNKAKLCRSGLYFKKEHLQYKYDFVITLSESFPFSKQYDFIYNIYPTGIFNPSFTFTLKNHDQTKKNFLWLGSQGAIHKGLDILLDVFRERSDVKLYVAGLNNKDKKKLDMKNINVMDVGFLDINSTHFLDIVNQCSFMLLPSCSEGFSTAVCTAMLHGLIPVVMKDAGFNRIAPHAIYLEDYHVDYVDKVITELIHKDILDLQRMSEGAYMFSHEHFVMEKYSADICRILHDILKM